MPQITSQGFLTRNITEYLTDSKRVKQYRCNTLQNPLAYKKGNQLLPVDVANVANSFTDHAGSIWLRDKNIVSVGVKKADDAYKCIGLRPDEDQSGNEQLEWSIEAIEKNGKVQSIDLSEKQIISPTAQNLGPMVVQSTRQRTRIMLPMTEADEGFRIALRLHLKGLTVQYRADLDEYWIYNTNGQFRFRLRKPYLVRLNAEGFHDPLDFSDLEAPPVMVQHKLIDNGNGTYTYIKEPGPDFGKVKLPTTFLVDADIVYSSVADGSCYCYNINWDNVHDASTSNSVFGDTDSQFFTRAEIVDSYKINRSFFYHDLSVLSGVVTACSFYIHSLNLTYTERPAVVQKGTQGSPLSVYDYDAFSGSAYATKSWVKDPAGYNEFEFNSIGIDDMNASLGGIAKLCGRDKPSDYDDIAPPPGGANVAYFANMTSSEKDPYLYLTINLGWTGKILGVTNPAKIWGIPVANIAKIHGL